MLVKGAGVLTILCYGWMIIFVPYILNVAILAKGQYWTFFVICLLGNIFDLILNVIFVPLLGIEGAAYTTVFSYILVNMASLLYLYNRKILPIQKKLFIPSTTFVKVILASLALVMFSKLSPFVETWYFFGVKSFVAFLLYSGILFILREFNQEDKKIIQFLKSSVMQKISFRGL
jgi:Na+-driven multidrug efflux pump